MALPTSLDFAHAESVYERVDETVQERQKIEKLSDTEPAAKLFRQT